MDCLCVLPSLCAYFYIGTIKATATTLPGSSTTSQTGTDHKATTSSNAHSEADISAMGSDELERLINSKMETVTHWQNKCSTPGADVCTLVTLSL